MLLAVADVIGRSNGHLDAATSAHVRSYFDAHVTLPASVNDRTLRKAVTALATVGLVDTGIEATGDGNRQHIAPTIDYRIVHDLSNRYFETTPGVETVSKRAVSTDRGGTSGRRIVSADAPIYDTRRSTIRR